MAVVPVDAPGGYSGVSDAEPQIRTPTQPRAGLQGPLQLPTPPPSSGLSALSIARAKPPTPPSPTPAARSKKSCSIGHHLPSRPSCGFPRESTAHRLSSSLPSPHPPRDSNSAEYLQRLIRIAKRRARHLDNDRDDPRPIESPSTPSPTGPPRPPPGAMSDFLAGFNFGAEKQPPRSDREVANVQELQARLLVALQDKVTPTRAEHVGLALELRASVRFTVGVSDGENRALEGLDTIDPSLGGLSNGGAVEHAGGQASRVITANETLMSQSENPALQRTVAKHIIGAVSGADGSTWVVRDMSRGSQGWSFTYICKDSHQHWTRQNSKNTGLAVIGEYSFRDADPALMGRPAFDCRGSAVITFNRSSRAITVKYDHTLLHKTVGELSELCPPPARQLGPGAQKLQQQKTPKKPAAEKKTKEKKPASEKKPREPGSSKKRAPKNLDENGQPKKRRKKNNSQGEAQSSVPEGPMIPPDYPHGSQENASSWPERPSDQQAGAAHEGDGAQGSNAYPLGLVNDPAAARQNGTAATLLPFNVSADEAARRTTIARKLLADGGVNPDSLSTEQMNIFSNQAPELQKDSLAMLARYGAERLQIIHPSHNKGKPDAAGASSAQAQSTHTAPGAAAPTTTKELSLQTDATPSKGKGGKNKGSSAKDTPTSKRKLGKSRLACLECKSRRVKCPKERPTCAECQSHDRACQYPPTKPRARKSNAVVEVEDDDDDAEDDDEDDQGDEDSEVPQAQHQQNPQHVSQGQTALPHEETQDATYAQMPLAGMLTPHAERTAASTADTQPSIADHGYFQTDTGLSMPQPDLSHLSQPALNTAPGLALPQAQMFSAPEPNVNMSSVYPQSGSQTTSSQSVSPKLNKRQPRGANNANRRGQAQPQDSQTIDPRASSAAWAATGAVAPSTIARDNTASPVYPPPPAPSQHRTRQSDRIQANSPHLNSSVMAHSQQAQPSQQPAQMLAAMQTQGRESPFPVPQRTSSRTSRSSQNRTPNADARGYRPAPPQNQPAVSDLGVSTSQNSHGTNAGANTSGLSTRGAYSTPATSSQHAYDYNRNSQQTSTSANQWPATAQTQQGQQTRSYETRPPSYGNNNNAYAQSRNATQPPVSAQGFDMRPAAQAKPANPRAGKQTYSQYPSQTQPQTTQSHHQSSQAAASNQHLNQNSADWYGFNGGTNNSFTSANPEWL